MKFFMVLFLAASPLFAGTTVSAGKGVKGCFEEEIKRVLKKSKHALTDILVKNGDAEDHFYFEGRNDNDSYQGALYGHFEENDKTIKCGLHRKGIEFIAFRMNDFEMFNSKDELCAWVTRQISVRGKKFAYFSER